ncbi:D-hexose-6-phosphate mutarotase [soil metagenome]
MTRATVLVEYGDDRIEIAPFGAQIVAASVEGHPLFFRAASAEQALENAKPVRGGVPLLFPQFADVGPLLKHGFARISPWTIEALATAAHEPAVQAIIEDAEAGRGYKWHHSASLTFDAAIEARTLTLSLRIENTGPTPFLFTGGLHPYFAVSDLDDARLHGLDGCTIRDRTGRMPDRVWPANEPLQFGHIGPIDAVVLNNPSLVLETGPTTVRLTSSGCSNWVVWNPGAQHGLADVSGGEWRRFVCVEPAHATAAQPLVAGESTTMSLRIELL